MSATVRRCNFKRPQPLPWPLRDVDLDAEPSGVYWAVAWLQETLSSETLRAEYLRRRKGPPRLVGALWQGACRVRDKADEYLDRARDRGALLFCWEGSTVMTTPVQASGRLHGTEAQPC